MNKLWFLFPFLFYVVCVDDGQKTYDGGCKKENHKSDKVMLTRKMIFGK